MRRGGQSSPLRKVTPRLKLDFSFTRKFSLDNARPAAYNKTSFQKKNEKRDEGKSTLTRPPYREPPYAERRQAGGGGTWFRSGASEGL